jgi:hypothetical protein
MKKKRLQITVARYMRIKFVSEGNELLTWMQYVGKTCLGTLYLN